MPDAVGYLDLIRRNRDFRYLWGGHIVSLLGDWFNYVATAALLAALTGSGQALGLLFVVRMLAPFLVSPIAGVLADRVDRKALLIATDLVRAVVVLGFLAVDGPEDVWLLYVLTFLQLAVSGFFFPARNAILPDLVSKRELGAANALSSATWSVMLALGAALGGLVAGKWGTTPAFVIDSATFLLSAALISRVRCRSCGAGDAPGGLRAAAKQYLGGLVYIRRHLDVLFIGSVKAANSLIVVGAFSVLQVKIATDLFPMGEGGGTSLGLMMTSVGIGTGLGPILARAVTGDDRRRMRVAIAVGFLVSAAGLLLVATLGSFAAVLAGTFLRGLGAGTGWVFSTALLMQLLPNEVRGRVFSTEFATMTLFSAAGSALGGWALDSTGLGTEGILRLQAAACLLPAGLWAAWTLRGRHQEPPSAPGEADPPPPALETPTDRTDS